MNSGSAEEGGHDQQPAAAQRQVVLPGARDLEHGWSPDDGRVQLGEHLLDAAGRERAAMPCAVGAHVARDLRPVRCQRHVVVGAQRRPQPAEAVTAGVGERAEPGRLPAAGVREGRELTTQAVLRRSQDLVELTVERRVAVERDEEVGAVGVRVDQVEQRRHSGPNALVAQLAQNPPPPAAEPDAVAAVLQQAKARHDLAERSRFGGQARPRQVAGGEANAQHA